MVDRRASFVVASIEARMGSTRFPGKMMRDIGGIPTIARVVERLRRCQSLDAIILATTESQLDDVLVNWAATNNLLYYRGSEYDVLGRVADAHQKIGSDIVVEICGDCPLLDPEVIDLAVETFHTNSSDLVTTVLERSFPKGMDVEVFSTKNLIAMACNILDKEVREHVSLSFYNNPDQYNLLGLTAPPHWTAPEIRCVLDYPEDLIFINSIYSHLAPTGEEEFGINEVIELIRREPNLLAINAIHKEG